VKRVREHGDTSRVCLTHAGNQHCSMLIEQLKHFAFERVIAQGHAEKMRAIDRLRVGCERRSDDRIDGFVDSIDDQGWKVEHLGHLCGAPNRIAATGRL
jgi:hypothetical protein